MMAIPPFFRFYLNVTRACQIQNNQTSERMALRRSSSMKTQLVNAIQLQEVELGETSTDPSNNTPAQPAEAPEVVGEERTDK